MQAVEYRKLPKGKQSAYHESLASRPEQIFLAAGTSIDKSQILTVKCDVLIPAAVSGVITADNAASLNCRFVVEAANVSNLILFLCQKLHFI